MKEIYARSLVASIPEEWCKTPFLSHGFTRTKAEANLFGRPLMHAKNAGLRIGFQLAAENSQRQGRFCTAGAQDFKKTVAGSWWLVLQFAANY